VVGHGGHRRRVVVAVGHGLVVMDSAVAAGVRDQQEEQNEEDQTNHRDTRILT
jgi:hypothetical protein